MRLPRIMTSIRSYIFFDVETTGLPYCDIGPTKITELSMVAVLRDHFDVTSFTIPRVLNKATFCVNPMKHISEVSTKITGLSNDLLDDIGQFDENFCDMLKTFIERLPQPVCLLAHNGDRFDFPILQSHFKSRKKEFSDSIMCADTLKGFRELKVMEKDPDEWRMKEDVYDLDGVDSKEVVRIIEEIELEFGGKLFAGVGPPSTPEKKPVAKAHKKEEETGARRALPMTPVKHAPPPDPRNETTPTTKRYTKSPYSYKLGDIHRHLIGRDIINQHSSESDALALLKIVTTLGAPFHEWVENNCQPLNNIKRMW